MDNPNDDYERIDFDRATDEIARHIWADADTLHPTNRRIFCALVASKLTLLALEDADLRLLDLLTFGTPTDGGEPEPDH